MIEIWKGNQERKVIGAVLSGDGTDFSFEIPIGIQIDKEAREKMASHGRTDKCHDFMWARGNSR
jgi:hypothetical protein